MPNDVREASCSPKLQKSAIEGGYWESIRIDDKNYVDRPDRPDKFTGKPGVWEVNLDDAFKTDPRKGHDNQPKPGKYSLSIEITIEGGPRFKFENLPMTFYGGRGHPNVE